MPVIYKPIIYIESSSGRVFKSSDLKNFVYSVLHTDSKYDKFSNTVTTIRYIKFIGKQLNLFSYENS